MSSASGKCYITLNPRLAVATAVAEIGQSQDRGWKTPSPCSQCRQLAAEASQARQRSLPRFAAAARPLPCSQRREASCRSRDLMPRPGGSERATRGEIARRDASDRAARLPPRPFPPWSRGARRRTAGGPARRGSRARRGRGRRREGGAGDGGRGRRSGASAREGEVRGADGAPRPRGRRRDGEGSPSPSGASVVPRRLGRHIGGAGMCSQKEDLLRTLLCLEISSKDR